MLVYVQFVFVMLFRKTDDTELPGQENATVCPEGQRIPQFHAFRPIRPKSRLRVLEAATSLQDLASLSSNHLEALGGDQQGAAQHPYQTSSGAFVLSGQKAPFLPPPKTWKSSLKSTIERNEAMTRRPVHPGRDFLPTSLRPLAFPPQSLPARLTYQPTASHKSLPESGRSPLTRLCAWVGISDQVPTSG